MFVIPLWLMHEATSAQGPTLPTTTLLNCTFVSVNIEIAPGPAGPRQAALLGEHGAPAGPLAPFSDVRAVGAILPSVTALFFSWLVPTLFAGRLRAA